MSLANNAYVILRTAAGVEFARVDDFQFCSVEKPVNGIDRIEVKLRKKSYLSSLDHKAIIEVWRQDQLNGVTWARIAQGYMLSQRWEANDPGDLVTLRAYGPMWLLATRVVAWTAGTASRSVFTAAKAETILKTLVSYNAGANATTANGRVRTGTITNLTIQTDAAGGNTVDWFCAWDNLLDTCQRLAKIAGGDIGFSGNLESGNLEFRFYAGQLGTDRTSTVKFSTALGNLVDPTWLYDRSGEASVAIVGGDGQGDLRQITTTTSSGYSASNDIEAFVNASDVTTANGRTDRGKKRLAELAPITEFKYKSVQTPGSVMEKHYTLGDKVTVLNPFTGASHTAKVTRQIFTFNADGQEKLDAEMEVI